MGLRRNVILSLKDFLSPILSTAGYSFTFVSEWTADKDIVLPKDFTDATKQIKLPAGSFTFGDKLAGKRIGLGEGSTNRYIYVQFYLHAETIGQLYDLLDLIHDSFSNSGSTMYDSNIITINDYSTTGYPPQDDLTKLCDMDIIDVRSRENLSLGEENVALNYSGLVSFTGKMVGV